MPDRTIVTYNPKTRRAQRVRLQPYAYNQGKRASMGTQSDYANPYMKYTSQWYSWDYGWNFHYREDEQP